MKIHYIDDMRTGKIRVRKVDEKNLAEIAAENAKKNGRGIAYAHGGRVANAYKYPALTEAVVAVAFCIKNEIHVAIYGRQINANKVTLGGVMSACLGGEARPLTDRRYNKHSKQKAREYIYSDVKKNFVELY